MRNFFSSAAFAAADVSGAAAPSVPAQQPVTEAKPEASASAKPRKAGKRNAGKPGKPAAKPVVAEAKPDPRAARAERIAAERSTVAALYAVFESQRASVPVKTLSAFKPASTTAHPIARKPSQRQAAAIAVAVAAAGKKLSDGVSVPRVFERENGLRVCIENGVLRDAVSSGLVSVTGDTPETETIKLLPKSAAAISGLIGSAALKAGKLV